MLFRWLARVAIPFAVALLPAVAHAQPWAGSGGLGVEVNDRGGRPLAEVSVVLAFLGTPGNGPELATDDRGRAEAAGLAEGLWVVSLRHPQFLGYDAQIRLEPGRKPFEVKAFQVKVNDSTERLRVRWYAVGGGAAAPRAVDAARQQRESQRAEEREARNRARTTEEEEKQQERAEREDRERRRESAAARRRAPEPEPAPVPIPEIVAVAAEPAEPPATPVDRTPAPPVAPPVAAPPEPTRAAPPAPAPSSPAERPAATPTPRAEPAPERPTEPPSPPPPSVLLRASRDGSCIECRPNEWAVTAPGEPRAAGPPDCPDSLRSVVVALAQRLGALPASHDLDRAAVRLLPPARVHAESMTQPLLPELSDLAGPLATGGCQVLALKLPRGASFQGFQLEVEGTAGVLPCIPDQDCPGGVGRWATLPVVEDGRSGRVIAAAFRHSGAAAAARPRLTVYFLPPSGWSP